MIGKVISFLLSPSYENIVEEPMDIYSKLLEIESRLDKLEQAEIENSNLFYELMNSIEAVDSRIDIIANENLNKFNLGGK